MKISEGKVIENMLRSHPHYSEGDYGESPHYRIIDRGMDRLIAAIMNMCEDYEDDPQNS